MYLTYYFTIFIIQCFLIVSLNADGGVRSANKGTYYGCFEKPEKITNLSSILVKTVDECVDKCEDLFHRYAVMWSRKCSCTNKISSPALTISDCSIKCDEKSLQFCGGADAESYFETGLTVAGAPRNLDIVNVTDTSITIEWDYPELEIFVSQYIIRTSIIHTYAPHIITTTLPQYTIQKGERKFELVNLQPATTYKIFVTSESFDYDDIKMKQTGGMASIVGSTLIGIPEPPPESPKILNHTDTTLTVELIPPVNANGPITFCQIIVFYIDSDFFRSFDQNVLSDFKKSQESGVNYYITAEIDFENKTRLFTIGDGRTYRNYYNAPLSKKFDINNIRIILGIVSIANNIRKFRYGEVLIDNRNQDFVKVVQFDEGNDSVGALFIVLIIACVIFGILLLVSIIGYFYLRMRTDTRLHRLPSDQHELTLQGPVIEVENNGYLPDSLSKSNFEDKLSVILNRIDDTKKYPRNLLTLDVDNVIGNGNFGDLIKGSLQKNTETYQCQVHVISDDMEPHNQLQFLKEFDQLLRVSSNTNLLNFYGITQTDDWLFLIFEDTPYTLKKRLIESRIPPQIDNYRFSSLSEEFILKILLDISDTLSYLSVQKFTHQRLCSYNVRLTTDDKIKISGFGATPFDDYGKTIDLTRWCAPEVLRFQYYSNKSDIWSFGCLMWETCCLGATLYANISSGDLLNRIKIGSRPEQPSFIYDDLYQLFLNCWQLEQSERPTFTDISNHLRQLLISPNYALSYERRDGIILPYYLPLLEVQIA